MYASFLNFHRKVYIGRRLSIFLGAQFEDGIEYPNQASVIAQTHQGRHRFPFFVGIVDTYGTAQYAPDSAQYFLNWWLAPKDYVAMFARWNLLSLS